MTQRTHDAPRRGRLGRPGAAVALPTASSPTVAVLLTASLAVAVLLTACRPVGAASGSDIVGFEVSGTLRPTAPEAFVSPSAVAVDHRSRLLIADEGRHVVDIFQPDGSFAGSFGGFGWDDGLLDGPTDLAVLEGFSVYVLDAGNRRVVRYDESGNFVDVAVDDGEAGTPVGMALGPVGGLYLVDRDSQTVLVRSQFNETLQPFGRFGTGEGGLVDPLDVAVGPGLSLAVADRGRRAVLLFDQFGTQTGVAAVPDTLDPVAVLFDTRGNLLVVDRLRGRVIAFDASGSATAALELEDVLPGFDPVSLARDGRGDVVVLDGGEGAVVRLRPVLRRGAGSR
jgi:hypothetical protein